MALEQELATFQLKLPEMLAHEGKFVVVHGDEVAGFWETYEDALTAGYETFGLEPFMVKKVLAVEPVQFLSRGIPTCQP